MEGHLELAEADFCEALAIARRRRQAETPVLLLLQKYLKFL
jgi:hypothetical protein